VPIFDYLVQAGSTWAAIVCYHELTRGQFVLLFFCFLAGLKVSLGPGSPAHMMTHLAPGHWSPELPPRSVLL